MQTSGADRAGADVEYRVVGGVSWVEGRVTNVGGVAEDPVIIGEAQPLNGQGPGPDWGVWAVAQAETTTGTALKSLC